MNIYNPSPPPYKCVRLASYSNGRVICLPPVLLSLGPEFQADLEFWQQVVDKGVDARGGLLSAHIDDLLLRPPQRTLFSGTRKKTAVAGYCLETGVCWRYDLTAQEQSRFRGKCLSRYL